MDSRAKFEAWCVNVGTYSLSYADSTRTRYVNGKTNVAWKAWQASREAIEVELPAYLDATTHGFSAFNDALDLCENEIRKHGISIKEGLPLQHEAKGE